MNFGGPPGINTHSAMQSDTLSPQAGKAAKMTLVAAFLGWMFDGLEMGFFRWWRGRHFRIWFAPETKDKPLPE
jgi:hypothetical protein